MILCFDGCARQSMTTSGHTTSENKQYKSETQVNSIDFAFYMQKHPVLIKSLPQRNELVLLEYYQMKYYSIT